MKVKRTFILSNYKLPVRCTTGYMLSGIQLEQQEEWVFSDGPEYLLVLFSYKCHFYRYR